jgi:hypothetical protein
MIHGPGAPERAGDLARVTNVAEIKVEAIAMPAPKVREFFSTPGRERLSKMRTRCPRESRWSARLHPTKPAPPVMSTS